MNSLLDLSYYDMFSLLSSDHLCINDEDILAQIFYKMAFDIKKLDLIIYPIRFTQMKPQTLFSICRDLKQIR